MNQITEIELYYDIKKKNKVRDYIEFTPVEAGNVETRSIFIFNVCKFDIDIEIVVNGDVDNISQTIKSLKPKSSYELELTFAPDKFRMRPIRANLDIQIRYLVK